MLEKCSQQRLSNLYLFLIKETVLQSLLTCSPMLKPSLVHPVAQCLHTSSSLFFAKVTVLFSTEFSTFPVLTRLDSKPILSIMKAKLGLRRVLYG